MDVDKAKNTQANKFFNDFSYEEKLKIEALVLESHGVTSCLDLPKEAFDLLTIFTDGL